MKKGASHVDWAISIGIFLVFVMLTLIFLRPGAEPPFKGDILLATVEDGLSNDTKFTISKGFLAITPQGISNGYYRVRIRNPTSNGFDPKWKTNEKYLGLVNNSLGTVPSIELLYTPYDLYDEYCNAHDSPPCLTDVLDIKTHLTNGEKNVLWFIYSEDVDYSAEYNAQKIEYGIEKEVPIDAESDSQSPNGGCFRDDYVGDFPCLLDGEDFTYDFGVVEKQRGYLPLKLEDLDGKGEGDPEYEEAKDRWGIPEDRNFQVTIEQRA